MSHEVRDPVSLVQELVSRIMFSRVSVGWCRRIGLRAVISARLSQNQPRGPWCGLPEGLALRGNLQPINHDMSRAVVGFQGMDSRYSFSSNSRT